VHENGRIQIWVWAPPPKYASLIYARRLLIAIADFGARKTASEVQQRPREKSGLCGDALAVAEAWMPPASDFLIGVALFSPSVSIVEATAQHLFDFTTTPRAAPSVVMRRQPVPDAAQRNASSSRLYETGSQQEGDKRRCSRPSPADLTRSRAKTSTESFEPSRCTCDAHRPLAAPTPAPILHAALLHRRASANSLNVTARSVSR
jgi:hypothetical protein